MQKANQKPAFSGTRPPGKFENVHQIGGIRMATLENGVRIALMETGSGLRFTVALDRGGDIVDARYNEHALAYLTPRGIVPPSPAYHTGLEWLRSWPGGLITSCGPESIGFPREQDGEVTSLHGRYSNTPATLESAINPDPARGENDMILRLISSDTRMFGPVYEVKREIRCTLGRPEIRITDEVTNRGNTRAAHHWLYHCNLGYPLLDKGAQFIYRGRAEHWVHPAPPGETLLQPISTAAMNRLKRASDPLPEHAGAGERGLLLEVEPDRKGICHVGLINSRLKLGVEFSFVRTALPRMANWQHYGPGGCYVTALEPFYGSLLGKSLDKHRLSEPYLEPGQGRTYHLTFRVCATPKEIRELAQHDGPVMEKRSLVK